MERVNNLKFVTKEQFYSNKECVELNNSINGMIAFFDECLKRHSQAMTMKKYLSAKWEMEVLKQAIDGQLKIIQENLPKEQIFTPYKKRKTF